MSEPGDSLNDFGLVISFVLPGITFLTGCSFLHPDLQSWLFLEKVNSLSITGLVLFVLVAVGAGLIVQAIRWLIVDTFHHHTGIRPGNWDFSRLPTNLTAFDGLTENHYRFYQFYSGMVIALCWVLFCRHLSLRAGFDSVNFSLIALALLMLIGSRDTLRKYYRRLDAILTQA